MTKIQKPEFDLIEHTAMQFAVVWYEAARSSGLTSKYKTARLWALHNFDKFIPQAVEKLLEILNNPNTHQNVKDAIYNAILERVNDPELQSIQPIDTLPDIDLKKAFDISAPPPIVVKSVIEKGALLKPVVEKPKKNLKNKLLQGVSHG